MEDRNRNNEAGMMRRGGSGGAHGMYWPPASPEDKEVLIESRTVGGGAPSSKRVVTAFQQDKGTEDDGGGDVVVFEQSDLHSTTFPIMTDLRRNSLLCDVTIKLNEADWAFGAHRVILAATCKSQLPMQALFLSTFDDICRLCARRLENSQRLLMQNFYINHAALIFQSLTFTPCSPMTCWSQNKM